MVNEQLLDYARTNLERGFPEDEVRQTLLKEGWVSGDVEEAINSAKSGLGPPEEGKGILKRLRGKFALILIAAGLVVLVAAFLLMGS